MFGLQLKVEMLEKRVSKLETEVIQLKCPHENVDMEQNIHGVDCLICQDCEKVLGKFYGSEEARREKIKVLQGKLDKLLKNQ